MPSRRVVTLLALGALAWTFLVIATVTLDRYVMRHESLCIERLLSD